MKIKHLRLFLLKQAMMFGLETGEVINTREGEEYIILLQIQKVFSILA